jgi:hypothetical protein
MYPQLGTMYPPQLGTGIPSSLSNFSSTQPNRRPCFRQNGRTAAWGGAGREIRHQNQKTRSQKAPLATRHWCHWPLATPTNKGALTTAGIENRTRGKGGGCRVCRKPQGGRSRGGHATRKSQGGGGRGDSVLTLWAGRSWEFTRQKAYDRPRMAPRVKQSSGRPQCEICCSRQSH